MHKTPESPGYAPTSASKATKLQTTKAAKVPYDTPEATHVGERSYRSSGERGGR